MTKAKKLKPITVYTPEQAADLANSCIEWLHEKSDNIFINDFLLNEKRVFANDIDYLMQNNEQFALMINQAKKIELAKLVKFGAADRLNATMVKQILTNNHDWI